MYGANGIRFEPGGPSQPFSLQNTTRGRGRTEPAANLARQLALGQVHRIGDRDDDQARVGDVWPVEEVVDDVLLLRDHLVELVDKDDAGGRGTTGQHELYKPKIL